MGGEYNVIVSIRLWGNEKVIYLEAVSVEEELYTRLPEESTLPEHPYILFGLRSEEGRNILDLGGFDMRQYNVEGQGIFTSLLDSVIYYVDAVRYSVDNECAQTAYDIASILRRRGFEKIRLDKDGGEFANPAPRLFASSPVGERRTKEEGRWTRFTDIVSKTGLNRTGHRNVTVLGSLVAGAVTGAAAVVTIGGGISGADERHFLSAGSDFGRIIITSSIWGRLCVGFILFARH